MAEFLKLRKDVKTPRRAILEFLDKATPKESPAIEDLTQTTAKVSEPLIPDLTPVTGSQPVQSQRSVMKRKLIDQDKAEDVMLIKKVALEMDLVELDSVMDMDIPSHLESPIVNLPKRSKPQNRRRISTAAFKQAIEQSKALKNVSASADNEDLSGLSDASIPLTLNSPDLNLPSQIDTRSRNKSQLKSKRVSNAAYKEAIESNKAQKNVTVNTELSGLSDDSIPSSLNSPDLNLPRQARSKMTPLTRKLKKRLSTAAFKEVLQKRKQLEKSVISKEITSTSVANEESSAPDKNKKSTLDAKQSEKSVIAKETASSIVANESIVSDPNETSIVSELELSNAKDSTEHLSISASKNAAKNARRKKKQLEKRSMERASLGAAKEESNAPDKNEKSNVDAKKLEKSVITKATASSSAVKGKTVALDQSETSKVDKSSTVKDVSRPELSNTMDLKKRVSAVASEDVLEKGKQLDKSIVTRESTSSIEKSIAADTSEKRKIDESSAVGDVSGLGMSNSMDSMDSSVPSSLASPVVNLIQRPCPKSKKRVSMTAFKEILQKIKPSEKSTSSVIANKESELTEPATERAAIEANSSVPVQTSEKQKSSDISKYSDESTLRRSLNKTAGLPNQFDDSLPLPEAVAVNDVSAAQKSKLSLPSVSIMTPDRQKSINSSKYSDGARKSVQNLPPFQLDESTPNRSTGQQSPSSNDKYTSNELPESENAKSPPEVALPEDFFPAASSTQMADKMLDGDAEPIRDIHSVSSPTESSKVDIESVTSPAGLSKMTAVVEPVVEIDSISSTPENANRSVNLSVSDIPSDMESLDNGPAALRLRPSQASKKRVSMTEFLTALAHRKAAIPDEKSQESETNDDGTFTVAGSPSKIRFPRRLTTSSTDTAAQPEVIPTSDNQDSDSDSIEMIRQHLISVDKSRSKSAAVSSPPDFSSSPSVDSDKSPLESSRNRSRKSLKFESPTSRELAKLVESLVAADAEKPPYSDDEEQLVIDLASDVESTEKATAETPMLSRYPAMKNSTVIAGGLSFYEPPLPISPISNNAGDVPPTVQATPIQWTKKSNVLQSPMYMDVVQKMLVQKTKEDQQVPESVDSESPSKLTAVAAYEQEEPMTESTPVAKDQSEDDYSESIAVRKDQSEGPQFKSAVNQEDNLEEEGSSESVSVRKDQSEVLASKSSNFKTDQSKGPQSKSTFVQEDLQELGSDSDWEDAEEDLHVKSRNESVGARDLTNSSKATRSTGNAKKSLPASSLKSFDIKGLSSFNPLKGKSLSSALGDGVPLAVRIAQEDDIVDRSRDFVPLEIRLSRDPIFQEKVRSQKEKIAAEKASQAVQKDSKKKARVNKAIPEDNIASASVNKANFRFYSQPMKVSKDALDAVHKVVGQWMEFTLDQMEIFLANSGKESLDSWEDCYKMLKAQGIVKNYWDYSGLCHELLTQDECSQLLPSGFPPGHYEDKKAAKRNK